MRDSVVESVQNGDEFSMQSLYKMPCCALNVMWSATAARYMPGLREPFAVQHSPHVWGQLSESACEFDRRRTGRNCVISCLIGFPKTSQTAKEGDGGLTTTRPQR